MALNLSSKATFALWLCGVWGIAFALRVTYLVEVSDSPFWLIVMGDARSYDTWARSLADGNWLGHDVFYQAPLYPYFMGVVYRTLGDGAWTLRVVQCLLGATGCVLLAVAGARFTTPRTGLTAGILFAFYPAAMFFDGLIQKTTLTTFFLCALLAVTGRLATRPDSLWRWCLAGALTGLLSLVRENAIVLAAMALIWIAVCFRQSFRARISWSIAFVIGVAALLAPVTIRNGVVGGEWHLTTSQFGPNFFIGNHADADGFYTPLLPERGDPLFERADAIALAEEDLGRKLTPREVSRYWTREAFQDLMADPVRWVGLLFRKLWLTCGAMEIMDTEDQYSYAEYSRLLSAEMTVWHMGVLLPTAAFGATLLLSRRRWRRRLAWPSLMIIGYTASVLLFFVLGRYRFPLVPPLMLFASAGIWETVRLARRHVHGWHSTRRELRRRVEVASVIRLAGALSVAACVAVPANILPYPIERAKAVTRENLGEHLYAAGFPTEVAIAEYERAVALTPDNVVLRSNFAKVLWDCGERDRALEQLEAALRETPHDSVTLVELGLMLRDLDEFEASADRLRAAVDASPDMPEPAYHLAVTLLKHADHIGTAAAADAVSHGLAPTESASTILADFDRAQKMRSEAAKLLRQSIVLQPNSEAAHAALGSTLAKLGDATDAAEEFGIAAQLAPEGSTRQARHRHMQQRLSGAPVSRRSVSSQFRRRRSP